jgi:hypothetical protein
MISDGRADSARRPGAGSRFDSESDCLGVIMIMIVTRHWYVMASET